MANITACSLNAEWDWGHEKFHVTGTVTFMFGADMYKLTIDELVMVPSEYTDVAAQLEHIFMDLSAGLGKLGNARLSVEAEQVRPHA